MLETIFISEEKISLNFLHFWFSEQLFGVFRFTEFFNSARNQRKSILLDAWVRHHSTLAEG